ncbi:unnamed protein product [Angiostrongylus costaricensis]|uniref:Histone-lysine N-methyltransferase SETMAR n=1 Tax=Angiostrongylus costaricensis TaxID=334426 RepID=A0A0R3PGA5_ANGCS|nr:unnamed protein product [Angiostrongylus costaricensis]
MTENPSKSLENHPLLGRTKLRQTLTKTRKVNTLINAVKRFQDENSIKLDTLPPALQLLDLHKIKRHDFYDQAAADISEQVVARIRALGEHGTPESRKEDLLISAEPSKTNFFTFETTKARRQWKEIKDLIMFIGTYEELFLDVTAYIREIFSATGDVMLCSLRNELIMAAHDGCIENVVKADPCHDFAWCLEACMRDKHLESHQTNRLRHILDNFLKTSYELQYRRPGHDSWRCPCDSFLVFHDFEKTARFGMCFPTFRARLVMTVFWLQFVW